MICQIFTYFKKNTRLCEFVCRSEGHRGAGNLEDGIPIYFERQNTPGNIVQRSAQIVFPTQKAADTFYQKYSLILKRK